jgi:nitrite reductase (NADH) large subunit
MAFDDDPYRTICFCHNVSLGELLAAIRRGAITLQDIRAQTDASTGCGGCECDVLEILERELSTRPKTS